MRTIVITGAAGRDFHDFNVVLRDDPDTRVAPFTRGADSRHREPRLPAIAGRDSLPERHPDPSREL
jgi:predicted GTPase